MIRTRFAPSPTGWLHIGGVRTALFSWLYAKSLNGEFYIRIDDTDTSRSTKEFCDSIIKSLNTLNIKSDKDLIYQSNRFDIYIDKIEYLLQNNHAYYDEVEINEKTKDTDLSIQYSNRLNKPNHVIRFRNPRENAIVLNDLVHGKITFEEKTFHDVVILRSNGVPTYNLTSVVDDAFLEITHIIRGDDHLSNTAIQINLFKALGENVPVFGHLPMIHGIDNKRLSKRHGAVDINTFFEEGYLPDALINYLVKTGWSHGDQEFFSTDELIKLFTIEKVTKSSAIFDYDKLNWLNQYYIKTKDISEVSTMIMPYLRNLNIEVSDKKYLENILSLGIERDYNLKNISNSLIYYFQEKLLYNNDDYQKLDKVKSLVIIDKILLKFNEIDFLDKSIISESVKSVCEELSLKFKDVGPVIRFALTARFKAPSIDELALTLGKSKVIQRLNDLKEFLT